MRWYDKPMKVFVAPSYANKVDKRTGRLMPEYVEWLDQLLADMRKGGHAVSCSLQASGYQINEPDPGAAFLKMAERIAECDALLALLNDTISMRVQTQIGIAIGHGKKVLLAHDSEDRLTEFHHILVEAGVAQEVEMPKDGTPPPVVLVT
jgi:hypothetical protein